MTPEFRAWVDEAKPVTIEAIVAQRGGLHLKRSGRELAGPCPHCQGDDRFAININKDVFNCRGCGGKGKGGIAFLQWIDQIEFIDAVEQITGRAPPHEKKERAAKRSKKSGPLGPIKETYNYINELGELVFQVVRHEPKAFRQRRPSPNEDGVWINGLDEGEYMRRGPLADWFHFDEENFAKWQCTERAHFDATPLVLYHLPDLIEAIACGQMVLVVEGEKDVATAVEKLGLVATTNPGGAGKWKGRGYAQFFRDADVVIIPDNDEDPRKGLKHANEIAQDLYATAERVRIAKLPGGFKDLTQWHDAVGTREDLDQIIATAPRYLNGHDPGGEAGAKPDAPPTIPTKQFRLIPCIEFILGFKPPNYLIDGILQRKFIYSLTGLTGHAKTAVALLLAELVASRDINTMLGNNRVRKGKVIYFAGENPDDVRARVKGSFEDYDCNLSFVEGVFNLKEIMLLAHQGAAALDGVDLVVIDTSAAYFLGDDEINNTQMGAHARLLRSLTDLPGAPCVLVLCHPVKHATEPEQLIPRGGGAFLNEMDGNLTLFKIDDETAELSYTKMRGPGFQPIRFIIETVKTMKVVDAENRPMPTVRARALSRPEEEQKDVEMASDRDLLLVAMLQNQGASYAALADFLDWRVDSGLPNKQKVDRTIKDIEKYSKPALIKRNMKKPFLTHEGEAAAQRVEGARQARERERSQGKLF
jgi:hypothetical protein